ncbi:MAG TPA: hypothetical protein DDY27_01505, partial [Hyphomonadaceae bacterium]|nr:hypothetical protein [Hyphomonadaceae bacterium]
MSDTLVSKPSPRFPTINIPGLTKYRIAIGFALAAYSFLAYQIVRGAGVIPQFRVDLTPLLTAPIEIQIHAYGAIATF